VGKAAGAVVAVGAFPARRRREAMATAVARDLMGGSLCGEVCRSYL